LGKRNEAGKDKKIGERQRRISVQAKPALSPGGLLWCRAWWLRCYIWSNGGLAGVLVGVALWTNLQLIVHESTTLDAELTIPQFLKPSENTRQFSRSHFETPFLYGNYSNRMLPNIN